MSHHSPHLHPYFHTALFIQHLLVLKMILTCFEKEKKITSSPLSPTQHLFFLLFLTQVALYTGILMTEILPAPYVHAHIQTLDCIYYHLTFKLKVE